MDVTIVLVEEGGSQLERDLSCQAVDSEWWTYKIHPSDFRKHFELINELVVDPYNCEKANSEKIELLYTENKILWGKNMCPDSMKGILIFVAGLENKEIQKYLIDEYGAFLEEELSASTCSSNEIFSIITKNNIKLTGEI